MASDKKELKVGDTVCCIAGGPLMIVVGPKASEPVGEYAECEWVAGGWGSVRHKVNSLRRITIKPDGSLLCTG